MTARLSSITLAALALFVASVQAVVAQAPRQPGQLLVLGRGTVEVSPDFASVSISVVTRARTPTTALDQNSAIVAKVIAFCEKQGIVRADIRSTSVSVTPQVTSVRDPQGNFRTQPDGYSAQNSVDVKLRDLARLSSFLRDVLETGADRIGNIAFGLDDRRKIEDEARALAVEDALRKASGLVAAANLKLGNIRSIASPPREEPRNRFEDGAADMPSRKAAKLNVPIIIGTLSVTAEVDVTWEISGQ